MNWVQRPKNNETSQFNNNVTMTHHKLLLCSTHGGASLSVLMGPDQKLHQAGNGTLFSERGVVGGAQCQVTDQPDCGLGKDKGV